MKIRSCVKLEQITDLKMKVLREANLPLTNNEAIQNMLKGNILSLNFLLILVGNSDTNYAVIYLYTLSSNLM